DKSYLSTLHEKGMQYSEEGGFGGEASIQTTGRFEYLLENIVTINKDIGGAHSFNTTLLQGINERRYERLTTTSRNFNNDILGYDGIGSGTVLLAPVLSQNMRRMVSFMGRVRYDFRKKYLITLTGRLDGSSVFSSTNKYGFFPSAAFAWKIHEESFMKAIEPVDNLKLRLSYGSIGNEAIRPYQTQALTQQRPYTYGNGATLVGYLPGRNDFPNTDLRWETSTTLNTAIDLGLFNGRVSGTFEYYISNTTDLLIDRLVPSATGYSKVLTNLGKVQNRGIELYLNAYMISRTNLSWSANFSFSRNKNEIIEATVDKEGNPVDDVSNRWFIGYPINVSYRYAFGGIWQMDEDNALMPGTKPGEIKLKDIDGDGEITPEGDRQITILDPSWIGSFGTNLRLWGFDLDAMFDFKKGGVRDNNLLWNGNYGAFKPVYNALKQPYWTPENPINTHPRPYFDRVQDYKSVLGLQDASYFRLRTLTLGYNFPASLSGRIGITRLRVYLRGTNLLTITEYQSYGPELNARQYPEGKIYSFGLNVSF
ncbi:MAG: SusC/RagA family TonB-linked outer membrane protein, partial [Bacteroidales bacterium]|nr:SusC/RagA family TonB-linked outer membrane protein [Bacteroidales bacterium]